MEEILDVLEDALDKKTLLGADNKKAQDEFQRLEVGESMVKLVVVINNVVFYPSLPSA